MNVDLFCLPLKGGVDSIAPGIVQYLVPAAPAEPLVSHIRLVDKYSVNPPTTYLSKIFQDRLRERKDYIEYRQGNLQNPAGVIDKVYDDPAPDGRPYTYVIDIAGNLAYNLPPEVHIQHTFRVAVALAKAAAKRPHIQSYIRMVGPFSEHTDFKKKWKESEEKGWRPWGARGTWWLEAARAVASIPNLPLVVIRCATVYGPEIIRLEACITILCGLIYKSIDKEMKFLWNPRMRKNTIHIYDLAGAIWACAQWIADKDRATANALAGDILPPSGDKDVPNVPDAVPKSAGGILVPCFNITDDGDTTQETMNNAVGRLFGIKVGFHGTITNVISGMRMRDVAEDVNESHMQEWGKIIQMANPPVPRTPLSPYVDLHILDEHGIAMDNEKLKRIVGYKMTYPSFCEDTIRQFINWARSEGIWPETEFSAHIQ
ncbi:hypothetical protein PIIN_07675 [Serendipita indica DSM 11827]|uniref:NAD-dependent epimerase/dehydratase domain-containing protein n=1 Tax=Serendipita indica (strain DSM 11827) TaxID=1109443 RepID=G4TQX7_SERID|nr:hypothetical protein PIIN_07675 [Serendipita indica DSM 11827]